MVVKIKLIYFLVCVMISIDGFAQQPVSLNNDLYDLVPLSNPNRALFIVVI